MTLIQIRVASRCNNATGHEVVTAHCRGARYLRNAPSIRQVTIKPYSPGVTKQRKSHETTKILPLNPQPLNFYTSTFVYPR